MIALLWLLLVFGCGNVLRLKLLPSLTKRLMPGAPFPAWLMDVPVSLLLGVIPIHTLLFFLTALFSYSRIRFAESSLLPAMAVMGLVLLLVLLWNFRHGTFGDLRSFFARIKTHTPLTSWSKLLSEHWPVLAFFSFIAFAAYFLYDRSLYQSNGCLYSGPSVVSDYGPHIANLSAFVRGDNYVPLDYPVFTGAGMRYHFFFFFFSACLHALGLSLPAALNLASAVGLFSFAALMAVFAVYFTRRRSAIFWIQPLWFFHSSLAWLPYLIQVWKRSRLQSVGFFELLRNNQIFIGTQPHDDWGLWNMNVYANQRHLLFALAAILLVLFVFLPSLRVRTSFRALWQSREAWRSGHVLELKALYAVLILMLCLPYWHGAATLGLLVILFLMALWARFKLAYLLTAFVTLLSTLFYSRLFSGGVQNIIRPQFVWGFLSEDKSLGGVLLYLFVLLGLAFIAMLISPVLMETRTKKIFSLALIMPLILALTLSLTPDLNVNHKYIIMTRLFLCLPTLSLLIRLWESASGSWKRLVVRGLAFTLAFFLCLSGLIDFGAFYQKNKQSFPLSIDNEFIDWLENETPQRAVFLTPTWFYHPFYYSGRQAWYGWPYYAWSAGYDSQTREALYLELWSGCEGDFERFKALINEHNLSFALVDDNLRVNQKDFDEDFFLRHFPVSKKISSYEKITIYDMRAYLE